MNHSVVDALPSSSVSVSVSRLRTLSSTGAAILAAMASGVLLALPYNFPSLYLLTWVAFVPLLWVTRMSSLKQAYGLGFCAGLVMYVIGAFWIVDFIDIYQGLGFGRSVILAVVFWLYCAQLLALLLLLYRWLRLHTGLSELVLFPPLVAMFYSGFPMLFSVPLGGSQSYFLVALQATEFFGAASLDFIIALTNVLLFVGLRVWLDLRAGKIPPQPSEARSVAVLTSSSGVWMAALLIVSWLSYGIYAVPRWDAAVAHWPVQAIGIVQPNETPSDQLPLPTPGYSWAYPPEMALTEKLAQAGAAVIVWPETRYKRYFADPHVEQAFAAKVANLGVPLMFQDIEALGQGRDKKQYNTSVYLNAEGELAGKYRKIKRVPLGEYVPGLQHVEPFRDWLYHNLPAFFADFLPGEAPAVFTLGEFAMVPLICYEVMFSELTAEAVGDGRSRVIVAISNNGWFGSSYQPYQHLHASVLRSVENRVPMVHLSNNGPSGLVLPSGRMVVETAYHQKMAALLAVPYSPSSGGSLFSRYPSLFLQVMQGWLGLLVVAIILRRFLVNEQS